MTARTLQFFNPVVQIVARQAVQDLERRADIAVTAQGRSGGLAAAVHALSIAADVHSDLALPSEGGPLRSRSLASAHRRALDVRCQLLREGVLPAPQRHRAWRLGLTGAALAALLFLVV
jgi:beta-lactamase regulating signal transducer with metallopeptidase domain